MRTHGVTDRQMEWRTDTTKLTVAFGYIVIVPKTQSIVVFPWLQSLR